MLANINNNALKITLSSHQNLARNTALISLVPLVRIIQCAEKKNKNMKTKVLQLHYVWSSIHLAESEAWAIFILR